MRFLRFLRESLELKNVELRISLKKIARIITKKIENMSDYATMQLFIQKIFYLKRIL